MQPTRFPANKEFARLPTYKCFINKKPYLLLLDSGSQQSIISLSALKELGLTYSPNSKIAIRQITNSLVTLGCTNTFSFTLGNITQYITAQVLDTQLDYFILALDYAKLFNLFFNFETTTLFQNRNPLSRVSVSKKFKLPSLNTLTTNGQSIGFQPLTTKGQDIGFHPPQEVNDKPINKELSPTSNITNTCQLAANSPVLRTFKEVLVNNLKPPKLQLNSSIQTENLTLNINKSLKTDELSSLQNLISNNKSVFSKYKFDIGLIKLDQHKIQLTNDTPIYERPYRATPKDSQEINAQVNELLNAGIIRRSYSSFASPVTLAGKKGQNKNRLCIDYRKLNDRIILDRNPIPRIDNLLDHFSTAKFFSTLDITKAYHHIEIDPESIHKTAFVTNQGQYEFLRLPFGLKCAPSFFQRTISRLFQKYNLTNTLNYFDDVIIYSDTFQQHIHFLEKIFIAFNKENIKLNLDKCHFAKTQVSFLGYLVSHKQIEPHPSNLNAIHKFPKPKNVKELQRFLGMINVYNKFIPEYSKLRNPLNKLLKKNYPWFWTDNCDTSYYALKDTLIKGPILAIYSPDKPCSLFTDASGLGIGAVLKQPSDDGTLHPIAYHSRSLHSYEQNYSATEIECLALVDSITKFHHYLYSEKFTVFTDHAALQWLKTIKKPSGRLFRWSMKLSQYEFEIRHISGRDNIQPDCLSRAPAVNLLTLEEIRQHNPSATHSNNIPTINKKGFVKIIVPQDLRTTLLQRCHQTFGHPGVKKMQALLSPYYYWPEILKDISQLNKQCDICQRNKTMPFPKFGLLQSLPPAEQPFDLLSIDTIGGFINYGSNKSYIHLIIDHATRYIWTFASKNQDCQAYITSLKTIFSIMKPKKLLSDRAPAFLSSAFKHFLTKNGVTRLLTSSHHPQTNGLNERTNRTIVERLRCRRNDPFYRKLTWPTLLQQVTSEYNHSPHSTTKFSPAYLLFGIPPYEPPLSEQKMLLPLEQARKIAFQNVNQSHEISKLRYDKKFRPAAFKENDLVLMETHKQVNLNKLTPICHGPYKVLRQISPTNYEIDKPNQVQNRNTEIVHSSKLRLYVNQSTPPISSDERKLCQLPKTRDAMLPNV